MAKNRSAKSLKGFSALSPTRPHIADNYDFAFGTRFHGNVAALQAGVPALWLEHDMRLQELCQHFALPSISQKDFEQVCSVEHLKELCNFTHFELRLPRLMKRFLGYLEKNGVLGQVDAQFLDKCRSWTHLSPTITTST